VPDKSAALFASAPPVTVTFAPPPTISPQTPAPPRPRTSPKAAASDKTVLILAGALFAAIVVAIMAMVAGSTAAPPDIDSVAFAELAVLAEPASSEYQRHSVAFDTPTEITDRGRTWIVTVRPPIVDDMRVDLSVDIASKPAFADPDPPSTFFFGYDIPTSSTEPECDFSQPAGNRNTPQVALDGFPQAVICSDSPNGITFTLLLLDGFARFEASGSTSPAPIDTTG